MVLHITESGVHHPQLVVFIHGGGVSGWMWGQQVSYFQHFHCLVPDLAGHGFNHEYASFSIRQSAEHMVDVIETKGKGKQVIVAGFSIGAQILIEMRA